MVISIMKNSKTEEENNTERIVLHFQNAAEEISDKIFDQIPNGKRKQAETTKCIKTEA